MAYFYRLVFLLCGMLPAFAHASFPATQQTYQYRLASNLAWDNTREEAASRYLAYKEAADESGAYNYRVDSITTTGGSGYGILWYGTQYNGVWNAGSTEAWFSRQDVSIYSCPANSTLSGTTCTCNSGYSQDGNSCVSQQVLDDANCKNLADGLNLVGAPMVHYGVVGLTACFGGYVMSGTGAASGGGQTELYGPFKCTGANALTCAVVPKPADITANCAPGSYPGTVNGVQVCIPPTDTVTAPKETTATPPAPGASAPQIPGAPPGTTSTTETTTCTNGSCTTTINYKDGAGESLGKKEDVKSQPQFCTENPKAPGCAEVDASKFSGSCDSGFTYKGDAIVGAMAAEIHRQNCLLNKSTEESGLYDTERVKTGDQTSTLPGNEVVNVGSGSFDSSDAIGGAACIANKTIVVWGRSVVLPFSDVCPALGYLKNILLAISWFTAAGIVIGRKT